MYFGFWRVGVVAAEARVWRDGGGDVVGFVVVVEGAFLLTTGTASLCTTTLPVPSLHSIIFPNHSPPPCRSFVLLRSTRWFREGRTAAMGEEGSVRRR